MLGCKGSGGEGSSSSSSSSSSSGPKLDLPPDLPPAPDACLADKSWFTAPSQPDGSKFPGNDKVTNCDFHLWSIQTYLWLTSKQGDQTVFEAFANPNALFVPGGPTKPYPGHDPGEGEVMLARMAKDSSSADIADVFQAGPGNEILVDQNGEVVYYSNHLDKQFWDFINAADNQFWDLAKLQAANPELDFPVDSLELKASWRVAEKNGKVLIPDADERFYVVETEIPVVEVDADGDVTETEKRVPAKMALIAIHVAGVVEHHPEFIWATFEHVDNAPDCAAVGQPTTGQTWSLYDGKASASACNQYYPNNPLGPVNVCRAQPHGAGSDTNQGNIVSLDKQLRELTAGTVWANYTYVGAIWSTGVVPLNNPPPDDLRGSLILANTTMETFKQDENCFSCHNAGVHDVTVGIKTTQVNGKHINLSHFVVNYQAAQQAKATK
ncbi:hypothetical protein [Enhygromyxa salina]|uniref:hypothetical protein n=1 Tax=Enhygromyxa salina TaxID=215803 RepID=UPI0011BA90DF|nr:hypothetical protein [Enhygromyxa salina]